MAAPPPVLTLAVEKGPRKGETRQCRAGAVLRVGRVVKGNDLAVRDAGASQQHLTIELLPPPAARWAVSDLGSSNGTILNGAPLVPSVPAPLSHGDLIKVGDSTVLAVSIASDADPSPGPTRSSRHAVAAVKPPVLTRRGKREKAAAAVELPDAEKEKPDTAAVVVEEKTQVVTRRGGRKKVAAAEPQAEMAEAAEATRYRGRKKAVEDPESEKEEEEATVVTCRGRRKKATGLSEQEKEEEEAPVVMRHSERKKDAVSVAPPLLPPKTRSGRGQGGVTRASARNTVLEVEEEEQWGNELAAARARTRNRLTSMAVRGGEKQEEDKVAAGDGEVEGAAKALKEGVPQGRASAQRAASGNGASVAAAEPHEETEKTAEVTHRGRRKKAIKPPELEKEEEENEADAAVAACRGGQKAAVVVRRGGRKKDAATIDPPPLPAKRSGRGWGRATRAGQRSTVLEEEEKQGGNKVAVLRERIWNAQSAPAVNDSEEEKGDNVAAGDGEAQRTVKALEEEAPKGRASARRSASDNGASAAAAEPLDEMEEAAQVMRHGGHKKAKVVTRRGGRKKDEATIAPPPLPAKTRSGRGRGRVTRASARNIVVEEVGEEEQEENEVAEEKGDLEAQGAAKALQEEVPKGRASAQHASSGNGGEVEQGGAHCSSRADSGSNGIPNTTSKYREDRKLKAYSTPFDVRLDRALKKYSA